MWLGALSGLIAWTGVGLLIWMGVDKKLRKDKTKQRNIAIAGGVCLAVGVLMLIALSLNRQRFADPAQLRKKELDAQIMGPQRRDRRLFGRFRGLFKRSPSQTPLPHFLKESIKKI